MQPRYKFFYGGDWNPFEKEAKEKYEKLTKERKIADPLNEKPLEEVFPKLDSWPDYVIAESKSTFWMMERAICMDEAETSSEIEEIWKAAKKNGDVDEWIVKVDGDEIEKAICHYMRVLHEMFSPNDKTVNFRLYFSEGGESERPNVKEGFTLTPYE